LSPGVIAEVVSHIHRDLDVSTRERQLKPRFTVVHKVQGYFGISLVLKKRKKKKEKDSHHPNVIKATHREPASKK
jgi:hypothetical protein